MILWWARLALAWWLPRCDPPKVDIAHLRSHAALLMSGLLMCWVILYALLPVLTTCTPEGCFRLAGPGCNFFLPALACLPEGVFFACLMTVVQLWAQRTHYFLVFIEYLHHLTWELNRILGEGPLPSLFIIFVLSLNSRIFFRAVFTPS